MVVQTGRFGSMTLSDQEVISIPQGVMGFPELKKFCLVDPADDTLILWLQSLDNPQVAFPVLEPKIFKPDYAVRLSAAELRELKLNNINQSAVFCILTIPADDPALMTANLKAPIVINLKDQLARQVVLQENEYGIRHSMFKELRAHLLTIQTQKKIAVRDVAGVQNAVSIRDIPPSLTVKNLSL